MKSAIDRGLNATVGRKQGERSEFTRPQLDQIEAEFAAIVEGAVKEIFGGAN